MNAAVVLSLMSSGLCLYVAVISARSRHAPGWSEQGWFALLALSGAVFAAGNAICTAAVASDAVVVAVTRVQGAVGAVQAALWMRYANVQMRRTASRWERVLAGTLLALGATCVVPGVVLLDDVHAFHVLGVTYRVPASTALGDAVLAVILGVMALLAGRFVLAWRRGLRHAGLHAFALAALVAFGANDALVIAGVWTAPFLTDLGALFPMSLVGLVLTDRFVEDSKALERLREELEALVGERTRQLASREAALERAEKLAGLGRLASGVAHEISSPLGAVTANLHYLADGLRRGEVPGDAMEAAEESLASLERIARTVRHLYDAGRTAPRGGPSDARVDVADVADRAVAEARARVGRPVPIDLDVEEGLAAHGEDRVVQEVLVKLLENAVQALPPDAGGGRVVVRAARDGERVRLEVADNGVGMCPETQRKAFDPFFSTWPQGPGTGLGLPVARGLVASLGGELAIRSAPGQGTSVVMELPVSVAGGPGEGEVRGSGI